MFERLKKMLGLYQRPLTLNQDDLRATLEYHERIRRQHEDIPSWAARDSEHRQVQRAGLYLAKRLGAMY
jgi:hypothetical protein